MGFTAKLICTAELTKDDEVQQVKVDDKVTVTMATPNSGEVEVSGTVVGIQLAGVKPTSNQYGPLFDGIATSTYNSDKLGNFRDATAHYAPEAFLVQVDSEEEDAEPENVFVPIYNIVELSVTPANDEVEGSDDGSSGTVETPAGPTEEDNF